MTNRNHGCPTSGLTRRTACSLGAGLSAAALGLPGTPGFAAERNDIRYVLTDRRYTESLEFAAVLARAGNQRLEITDGLTRLWQEALVPLWRGQTGAVAGLTQPGTWSCIAEQARSCRRRSVLVGRHSPVLEADAIEHLVSAPAPLLSGGLALENSGESWPLVMARLAARRPTGPGPTVDQRFRSVLPAAAAPSAHLVSWIIA